VQEERKMKSEGRKKKKRDIKVKSINGGEKKPRGVEAKICVIKIK